MDSLSIKVYKVQLFSFCCIIDLDHESQAMRFKEFKSNRFCLLERKLGLYKYKLQRQFLVRFSVSSFDR